MLTVMPNPTISGILNVRDFVPQLNESTKSTTDALKNAFKFGTQAHDYMIQRKQGNILSKENDRQTLLKENIANDKVLLAKMEQELKQLKAGNDVELRQGEELMQQNNVPVMQKYLDALHKTDENKSFWNWKGEENNG